MKKRYTEGQIAFALRQAASGTPAAETLRALRHNQRGWSPNSLLAKRPLRGQGEP